MPSYVMAQKLYKWVDENGNVTYQDRPPPEESASISTFTDQDDIEIEQPNLPDVPVVLFSIEECDVCDLVRDLLQVRGIPFEEKIAEGDLAVQQELQEISGGLMVPTLTIDEEVITGFNKAFILNELEEVGFPTEESAQASTDEEAEQQSQEGLSQDEIEQAAQDAADELINDDFLEEDDFVPLDENEELINAEEIPEDERIQVSQ